MRTEVAETVVAPRPDREVSETRFLTFANWSHGDFWRPPAVPVSQASSPRRLFITLPHVVDKRHHWLSVIIYRAGESFLTLRLPTIFSDFRDFLALAAGLNLVHG